MENSIDSRMRRVEVKARITEDLHRRLVDEIGHCGCSINGFLALAIAREIGARKARRVLEANNAVLAGQLEAFGGDDA